MARPHLTDKPIFGSSRKEGKDMLARLIALVCSSMVAACGSATTPGEIDPKLQTIAEARTFLAPSCPVTNAKAEALEAAFFSAVIPSLIDVGLKKAGSLIAEAAKENTVSVKSLQSEVHFYRATPEDNYDWSVTPQPKLGCVVVIFGTFADNASKATYKKPFATTKVTERLRRFKLASTPTIYFEGNLDFSDDGTKFRIVSKEFFYREMFDKGSVRDVVLTFNFNNDDGTAEGPAFAVGSLPFTGVKNGTRLNANLLGKKATGWMPLPAIDAVNRGRLDAARKASADLKSAKAEAATLKKALGTSAAVAKKQAEIQELEDRYNPGLRTAVQFLLDLVRKFDSKRPALEAKIQEALGKLEQLEAAHQQLLERSASESDLRASQEKIDGIRAAIEVHRESIVSDEAAIEDARIAVERQKKQIGDNRNLTRARAELEKIKQRDDDRKAQLNSAEAKVARLKGQIEGPLSETLASFRPISVQSTISETRRANEFLAALAEVLAGAEKGVGDALKDKFVPSRRAELIEAEKKKREATETVANTARRAVIAAMDDVEAKQIALDSLPSTATALERHAAESALKLAKFDANTAHRLAGLSEPFPSIAP